MSACFVAHVSDREILTLREVCVVLAAAAVLLVQAVCASISEIGMADPLRIGRDDAVLPLPIVGRCTDLAVPCGLEAPDLFTGCGEEVSDDVKRPFVGAGFVAFLLVDATKGDCGDVGVCLVLLPIGGLKRLLVHG